MRSTKKYHNRKSSRRTTGRRLRRTRKNYAPKTKVSYFVEKQKNALGNNEKKSGDIIKKFINGTLVSQKFVSTSVIKDAVRDYVAKRMHGGITPSAHKKRTPTPAVVYTQDQTSLWQTIKQSVVASGIFLAMEQVVKSFFEDDHE